jgi:hypothetical protein
MALPTLNWRYCAPVTLAANTTVGMLDALFTAGTAATYNDGSARTPGSGSAWTWARDTGGGVNVASYGTPPVNALNMRYIAAGATVLPGTAPTMIAPDTNVINRINLGMNKNSGAYAGWNLAAPFTSGNFSGYVNVAPATTIVTYTTLYYWECQEGFIAQFANAAGTQLYTLGGGAFIDPLASGALNAESDGRVYSITSTGNSTFVSTAWLSNLASVGPWSGSTAAGGQRFYQFYPGKGTLDLPLRISTATAGAVGATSVSPGGEFPAIPQFHFYSQNSSQYLGCLRQVNITRAARTGQTWTDAGTPVGYILSAQTAADQQCAVLMY